MKLTQSLRLALPLSMLFVLIGIGGAIFFGWHLNRQSEEKLASQVQPSLEALDKTQTIVDAYVLRARTRFENTLIKRMGPDIQKLPKPQVSNDLRHYVGQINEQLIAAKPGLEGDVKLLRSDLNDLADALNEFETYVNNIEGDVKSRAARNKLELTMLKAITSYNERIPAKYQAVGEDIAMVRGKIQAVVLEKREAIAWNQQLAFIFLVSGLGLGFIALALNYVLVSKKIHGPMNRLMGRMKTRQPIRVEQNEVGSVASYLNRLHLEQKTTEQTVEKFSKGAFRDEIDQDAMPERVVAGFLGIRNRMRDLEEEIRKQEDKSRELSGQLDSVQRQLAERKAQLELSRENRREGGLVIELDTSGNITFGNAEFLKASDFADDELRGMQLKQLKTISTPETQLETVLSNLNAGSNWSGELSLSKKAGGELQLFASGVKLNTPDGEVLQLIAAEVGELKSAVEQAENARRRSENELAELQNATKEVLAEQKEMRATYERQRGLEYRLVQQQAGLQELMRNDALKEGNVREALRAVTETATYSLDLDRVGLWLFANNGERIRCIDLYERQQMRHTEGLELVSEEVPSFYNSVNSLDILSIANASTDDRTVELKDIYLEPFGISAILTAPVRLGNRVVGYLAVEHGIQGRDWHMDEQNFLLSVAEVVSMALEQGNRRTMEEELRMTLEESQALEEELRQNAEEIEATNEEMRRTQIELRGQVSALNNAAIVSETNLEGRITYVNEAFAKTYGYDAQGVVGKSHNIVRSEVQKSPYYEKMWRTIQSGKVWKGELQNRSKAGDHIWVALTITPVLGLDMKPYKYIAVAFDITDRLESKQLVEEAKMLSNVQAEQLERTQIELVGQINALNNSAMVYETDMQGLITYANDELIAQIPESRDETIGQPYYWLSNLQESDPIFIKQGNAILNGEIWRGEIEYRGHNGHPFWALITTTPVLDETGEAIKCIHVLTDITSQKSQEFRLKGQQEAIVKLTHHPAVKEGEMSEAFKVIANIGKDTLRVNRVAIWMYEEEDTKVRCVAVAQNDDHEHNIDTVVEKSMYPNYFASLEKELVIASEQAQDDDRIRDLAFTLLKPKNITAVMDVAVRYGTRIVGLISVEHKDTQREWLVDEISFGNSLADTVGLVIEQRQRRRTNKLREAYQQLEDANQEMIRQKQEIEQTTQWLTQSIRYAKRIQNNILPDKKDMKEHLKNYFIVFRPKDIVGGDFYWFSPVDEKTKVVIVADGTGHGVPGAFLTLIGYLLLNQIVNERGVTQPNEILYHLHRGVRKALKQDEEDSSSRDGMDVSVATINMETYEVQYSGAQLPFYIYQDWEIQEIRGTKKAIGGEQLEEERTFDNHVFQLKAGDAIYMYTDGFVDQMGGPEEKRFSKRRFRDLVLRTQHESMKTQRALLNLEWKDWKDDREQLDDVTVFGMKFF